MTRLFKKTLKFSIQIIALFFVLFKLFRIKMLRIFYGASKLQKLRTLDRSLINSNVLI